MQNGKENNTMNISDIQKYQDEYEKLLKESPLEGIMNKITKDILEQKNNAMAMEFTRIIRDLLKRYGVYVRCTETKFGEKITTNSIEEQYGVVFDSMDFSQHDKEFTDKIEKLQSEVEKYRKAFEYAKKECDCQVAEYQKKIEELKNREIADLLPTDPIKVADMLINVMHEPCASILSFGKPYSLYDMSELRQIAEHLLVYCNHNREAEE